MEWNRIETEQIQALLQSSLPQTDLLLPEAKREEITGRIFKPFLLHGPFRWEKMTNNWSAVCCGYVASAAILLVEETESLAKIVKQALSGMEYYFAGFGDDGALAAGSRRRFAAKGGHNGEHHNHNDIGSFILTCDGEVFIRELGSGEYTAAYFGSERYTIDCNGAQGHSVPIVDGQYQAAGAEHKARLLKAEANELNVCLQIELADAYSLPLLTSLTRTLTWRKGEEPELVLEDGYAFTRKPESIVERFVTDVEPKQLGDADIILHGKTRSLTIRCDESLASVRIEKRSFRNHAALEETWYALDWIVRDPQPEQAVKLAFRYS